MGNKPCNGCMRENRKSRDGINNKSTHEIGDWYKVRTQAKDLDRSHRELALDRIHFQSLADLLIDLLPTGKHEMQDDLALSDLLMSRLSVVSHD